MITSTFQPQLIPLTRWADGSIRIGGTCVLLDLVVLAFNEGRTPEGKKPNSYGGKSRLIPASVKFAKSSCPLR